MKLVLSTPAAQGECSPVLVKSQEHSDNGGGEPSVFTNLTGELEGKAAEAELPACNPRGFNSPQHPKVGCVDPLPFCELQSHSLRRGCLQRTMGWKVRNSDTSNYQATRAWG